MVEKYQILTPSAYKNFHSTETALLKIRSDILSSMDDCEVTAHWLCCTSLLPFDTIYHSILLSRLDDWFGVTGKALDSSSSSSKLLTLSGYSPRTSDFYLSSSWVISGSRPQVCPILRRSLSTQLFMSLVTYPCFWYLEGSTAMPVLWCCFLVFWGRVQSSAIYIVLFPLLYQSRLFP